MSKRAARSLGSKTLGLHIFGPVLGQRFGWSNISSQAETILVSPDFCLSPSLAGDCLNRDCENLLRERNQLHRQVFLK